jgi:hypothetical protein
VVVEALVEVITTRELPKSAARSSESGLYRAIQSGQDGGFNPGGSRPRGAPR